VFLEFDALRVLFWLFISPMFELLYVYKRVPSIIFLFLCTLLHFPFNENIFFYHEVYFLVYNIHYRQPPIVVFVEMEDKLTLLCSVGVCLFVCFSLFYLLELRAFFIYH